MARIKTRYRENKSDISPVGELTPADIPQVEINGVEAEPTSMVSVEAPASVEPVDAVAAAASAAANADDAALALKRQIEAVRQAEELQRQQAAQMIAAQRPLTREEKLEFWRQRGLSDEETRFLHANPEMIDHSAVTNHAAAQALQAGHERDSEDYFAAVKTNFEEQMKQLQAQTADRQETPSFFRPPPQKAPPAPPNPSAFMSAPVSREIPTGVPRELSPSQVKLSAEEVEAAQMSGISLRTYAENKLRLEREKRAGLRQNG